MDIKKLLGKRIQEIRKQRNMTQENLAELVGIETVSLSNIERGKYYPAAENLNKILEILNIKPEELFTLSHLKPQEEMIEEILSALQNNEKLTRLIYKILNDLK